ncbi:MAG: hypothetical protein AAFP69_06000 [Planctomycetota bacterium]
MPKALCLISLVVAVLVVLLFMADAVMGMAGMDETMAPLGGASLLMDLTMVFIGAVVAFLSFTTFREQK